MSPTECDYVDLSPGRFICRACRRPTSAKRYRTIPPRRTCTGPPVPAEEISAGLALLELPRKGAHWVSEVRRWIRAGRPRRTQAEAEGLWEGICGVCDWREDDNCGLCGCRLPPTGALGALRSATLMATYHCPRGKW